MKIAIIDYGMGNIHSLKAAIKEVNPEIDIILTNEHKSLNRVDALFLPGVGHFGAAVEKLQQYSLIEFLRELVLEKNKPLFGICLGMQLLFDSSDESPNSKGLGLIEGSVTKFKNEPYKVPHIGFNTITVNSRNGDMLNNIDSNDFYFVHSYAAKEIDKLNDNCSYSRCLYNDEFIASVEKKHIWGTQFHPEKSQRSGLGIIKNFINKYVD
ncbi:imidazole glycerol phosphate synthase subunit HisH [Gracilimonas amylolytica]|uniref:imidazole glycerol phosphate synthase subunit HisH n=1 Tax=Gracilimonas amylolytica TaxID=1749045 RepID=UPI000CD85A24|nr:imidazole glycerol phosphate synthase subunit HisH [Gracilimonas amylolytica]